MTRTKEASPMDAIYTILQQTLSAAFAHHQSMLQPELEIQNNFGLGGWRADFHKTGGALILETAEGRSDGSLFVRSLHTPAGQLTLMFDGRRWEHKHEKLQRRAIFTAISQQFMKSMDWDYKEVTALRHSEWEFDTASCTLVLCHEYSKVGHKTPSEEKDKKKKRTKRHYYLITRIGAYCFPSDTEATHTLASSLPLDLSVKKKERGTETDHDWWPNTSDGLSEEDHRNGYHYYGTYKVLHICQQCGKRRQHFGYDYGWYHTLHCNSCYWNTVQ